MLWTRESFAEFPPLISPDLSSFLPSPSYNPASIDCTTALLPYFSVAPFRVLPLPATSISILHILRNHLSRVIFFSKNIANISYSHLFSISKQGAFSPLGTTLNASIQTVRIVRSFFIDYLLSFSPLIIMHGQIS